jgi:hypothetical protein
MGDSPHALARGASSPYCDPSRLPIWSLKSGNQRKDSMSRFKLTYANVMVTILAFIALAGGTAYAANQLAKNSVGTKQLKKNAVNGAKVKDQSLTGKDINLAKLGTVPSATSAANATTAGTASALTPPEAMHFVGAPGEPAFEDGSSNATAPGFSLQPVSFYKDHEGIVHLEGIAKAGKGPSSFTKVFTLPVGFRPPNGVLQIYDLGGTEGAAVIAGSNATFESTSLSGNVLGAEEKLVVLNGITFRAGS